ncbi:MAG: hypothetical protein V1734_00065, partial [Nanoarchaeota archaeon]
LKLNGESRTGKICERTKIPSSQIYGILSTLMEKGLASYKIVNNVKVFNASEPEMLARLFEEKEEEIKTEKAELLDFISKLKIAPKKAERLADFKYFQGIRGIKSLYEELINSWKQGDEYCIASAPLESFRKLEGFFTDIVHKKRIKDKVKMRIIINRNSAKWAGIRKKMPITEVRFLDIDTKTEYGVLNDYFFLVTYSEEPYGLLMHDKSFAQTYKVFFELLWKMARP